MGRLNAVTTDGFCGRLWVRRRNGRIAALTALLLATCSNVALAAGEGAHRHVTSRADGPSGVVLALLIAFAGALLGALVAYAARELRRAWSHRRGLLTGFWLWVTYDPGDIDMDHPVFSIELLEIKHRHSVHGGKIRGTAWRVFADEDSSTWDRRWTLTGWPLEEFVECVYKSETGGGNGVVNMWRTNPGYEGEYIPARKASRRGQPHDSIVTEWARLPQEFPEKLKQAIELIPADEARNYPRRVRRALGLAKPLLRQVEEWLPYAIASVDNQFALQATLASRVQEQELGRENGSLEIYRKDLRLGRHSAIHRLREAEHDRAEDDRELADDSRSAA
jgi:hypothetical protein